MTESTDIYNTSIHEYGTDNINVLGNYTNSSSAETVYSPGCVIYLKANTSAASRMVIPTITFTLGLCGNLIAIFVVWRNQNRSDKQSVFYTLIMTLACLDLTSNIMTFPLTALTYTKLQCIIEMGGNALCYYSGYMMNFFGISSMAIVFTMSLERLIAIQWAFFYHTKVTVKKTKLVLLVVIAAFALFSALPLVGFGEIEQQFPGTWCYPNWKSTNLIHQVYNFLMVILGLAMMLGTVLCNFYVILRVVQKRRNMKSGKTVQVMTKQRLKKRTQDELQMMVLLVVMTSVFVICYLPLLLRILINQLHAIYDHDLSKSLTRWDQFAVWMAAINPMLDPWVYILCRRSTIVKFFKLVKMSVTCKCTRSELQNVVSSGRDYKRRASTRSFQLSNANNTDNLISTNKKKITKNIANKNFRTANKRDPPERFTKMNRHSNKEKQLSLFHKK